MKIIGLDKWLKGNIKVEIEGDYIERLINLSINNGIFLNNFKRENATLIKCEISIKDFRKIRDILNKTQCKMKVLEKRGIPFIINRYRKRKSLVIFLGLIIFFVLYLSNYIWNIEIKIDGDISKEEITELLISKGVKVGEKKSEIKPKEISDYLRLVRDDISWVTVIYEGTNLKIEIKENVKKPEIIDLSEPCNIVAEKEGIVEKIEALNGTIRVEEGQHVKKGDLLIEGVMEGKFTGVRYVHSQGKVMARDWYTKISKVYYKQEEIYITKRNETKYALKIKNFRINLYKTLSNFEFYDTINENYKINLFGKFYLPIELIRVQNNEYTKEEKYYSYEEAIQKGLEDARNDLNKYLNADSTLLREIINTYENDQYVDVEVTYEVLESIGTKEKNVF